jgi:hypothetical protein
MDRIVGRFSVLGLFGSVKPDLAEHMHKHENRGILTFLRIAAAIL